jgi:hypothetical protein
MHALAMSHMQSRRAASRSAACAHGQVKPVPRPHGVPVMQAKLALGTPGDAYEREADHVADQVMRMPGSAARAPCACGGTCPRCGTIQRKCAACDRDDEQPLVRRKAGGAATADAPAPSSVDQALRSPGHALDPGTRGFFETRFGHDFSGVRVHRDAVAERSAEDINALAYTVGHDIVFGAGRFAPATQEGRRLLAHELAHVVQQEGGVRRNVIQRWPSCSDDQDKTVSGDHSRAREMLSRAIDKVGEYDGKEPTKVHDALAKHFGGATSKAFAKWIKLNLKYLSAVSWMAGYECFTGGIFERRWACKTKSARATTLWCVPDVAIRLCPPYFDDDATDRSTTMIHEWVHKYGCNFDLGYEGGKEYGENTTLKQLLNADSFSSFIRDVQ